jgi:hypothetical protein
MHRLPQLLLFALNDTLVLVGLSVLSDIWFGRTGGT